MLRTSRRHARIHLPPLSAEEALLFVEILDRATRAIWRAHGDAMAELLACIDPDGMPKPRDAVWDTGPDAGGNSGGPDSDFPF